MKEICNGKIDYAGICERCYQVSQTTSGYCTRLIEVPESDISPSLPSGTANEIFNKYCTLINKNHGDYIIRDKEGFIKAIDDFARSNVRDELVKYEEWVEDNIEYWSNTINPEDAVNEYLNSDQ